MHRPNPVCFLRGALICTLLCVAVSFTTPLYAQPNSIQSSTAASAAFGNCPPPSSAGVKVCFPVGSEIASPMQVIASGTGAGGPVKDMQLFVDGKKVAQVTGSLMDIPVTLAVGTHRVVVVEVDTTGGVKKSTPNNITVEQSTSTVSCDAPGSPGVHVCMPAPGSCEVSPWTSIVAAGTSATGTVRRMEVWVNGVKLLYKNGNMLNTNLSLRPGTRVVIQEVDSNGVVHNSPAHFVQPC